MTRGPSAARSPDTWRRTGNPLNVAPSDRQFHAPPARTAVDSQRLFKALFGVRQAVRGIPQAVILCLQIKLVRVDVHGLRSRSQPYLQSFRDRLADFVLNSEHVGHVAVEALRPQMSAGGGVDQLRSDAQTIARAAHAAFEHMAHAERFGDLADVLLLAAERERRSAGNHLQVRNL